MEYIVIIIIIISIILLKLGLNIHISDIKKIKKIGYDKKLNDIANKFPSNKEICMEILEKLNNKNVNIEETKDSKTSLYIAITNKIIIANINDTFTRIQTIAHECLHSIQNRRILLSNFIFSNISIITFIIFTILILLNIGNSYIYTQIFIGIGIIGYVIKAYLENEAMSKAFYLAKEYINEYQEKNIDISKDDIDLLIKNFDILNRMGIPLTNFYLLIIFLIKVIILCILGIIV